MPIYTELLEAALEQQPRTGADGSTGKLVAELITCRDRLDRQASSRRVPGQVSAAVADELAYDIALVKLCRRVGIPTDPHAFDPPGPARRALEHALAERGVLPLSFDGDGSLPDRP